MLIAGIIVICAFISAAPGEAARVGPNPERARKERPARQALPERWEMAWRRPRRVLERPSSRRTAPARKVP